MISKKNIIIAFAFCLAVFLSLTPFVRHLENIGYDALLKLRPIQKVDSRIVILAIDDATLEALGVWPLPRDFHASLIDVLVEFKVKNIVFDILFSEPSDQDAVFAQSIQKAGNVFLPQAYSLKDEQSVTITPQLKAVIKNTGHINVLSDEDGKSRRIPLQIKEQWPMTLLAASDALGVSAESLAKDQSSEILVNFPGRWESTFKIISYAGLLKDFVIYQESGVVSESLRQLEGKIALVGLTATGTSDFGPIPLDAHYPKVGLLASVINSFLNNSFIHGIPSWGNALLSVVALLAGAYIGSACTSLIGFLSVLAVACIFSFGAWLLLVYGIWIYLLWPLGCLIVAYLAVMGYRLINEEHQRMLLEKELDVARRIQQSFLPKDKCEIHGVSVVSFFRPAKYVAGDLYDIWKIDEHRVGVFIGDVSGKGVSAALVMAEAISVLRTLAAENLEPHHLLIRLNKQLHGRVGGRFVTALFFIVDTLGKKVYAVSAGHGPLIISRNQGKEIIDLPLNGQVPLGLLPDAPYVTVSSELKEGDRILVFSDGLPEARNHKGEEFGDQRVLDLIKAQAGGAADLLAVMQGEVERFSTKQAHDDITIVVAGFKGE